MESRLAVALAFARRPFKKKHASAGPAQVAAMAAAEALEFERAAASEDPESLAVCLDLYRGDLLDGYQPREPELEDWLRDARERLRATACQAMDRLALAGPSAVSLQYHCVHRP